jgi:prohibitin 2
MKYFAVLSGVAVLAIILVLCFFTATVDTGSVGVITNFGKITGTVLDSGWHIVGPFDHVTDVSTRVINTNTDAQCVSSDQQQVTVTIAVQTHITKESAPDIFRTYGLDYMAQATPKILDALKAETAKYAIAEITGARDKIRAAALEGARDRLKDFVVVDDFSIVNIDFSPDYKQAIEAKQVAQQRAEQAKYELQQAQVEADKAVATAKGEAEAIQIKGDALAKNPAVIQLELINKWDGRSPETLVTSGSSGGAGSIILPISAPAAAK